MKRAFILLSAVWIFSSAGAAVVDTIKVYSPSMKKNLPVVFFRPDSYSQNLSYPVVYLLHGYSGNYTDWVTKGQGLGRLVDQHNIIAVCPDGGFNSWYWNSPENPGYTYETFVSEELISAIDAKYSTVRDRKGRGITGLSMGGHGGLYLGIRHQDVFGVAGSMSGGVDIRPFPNNWDMSKQLGTYAEQPERWEKYTVINLLNLLTPGSLSIIIDCGTDDFFFAVNEKLHQELLYRNIPHDYIVRPGAHNWTYWNNAVKFQILYMKNYFESAK